MIPRGYSLVDKQNSPYNNVTLEDMYRVSGLTPAPVKIRPMDFNTMLEEKHQNRIQVYDIGGEANYNYDTQEWESPFRLETGYKRDDAQNTYESFFNDEYFRNNLTDTRTNYIAGFYGDNPFAVDYSNQILDIKKDPERRPSQTNFFFSNAVDGIISGAKNTYNFFYENWDFDEVKEILNKQDPNFNFQENGWNDINTEFGPEQGELVKKALIQNGWNPEQDGQGAGNRDAYMYAVKRKLRETAYVQWAENWMAKKFDQSGILDDPRSGSARMFQDIVTDYEIAVDIPLMFISGGTGIGLITKAEGIISKSQKLSKVQRAIKSGRAGFVRNEQGSLVAQGKGLGNGIKLTLEEETVLRQARILSDIPTQPARTFGGRLSQPATRLGTTTKVGRHAGDGLLPPLRNPARRSSWSNA